MPAGRRASPGRGQGGGRPGPERIRPPGAIGQRLRAGAVGAAGLALLGLADLPWRHERSLAAPHRLPHRGRHRDLVPARRAGPHRRHFRLHRATTAGAAREAQGQRLHQRAHRRDRGPAPRPRDRLFRHPGRHRRRPGAARHRGLDRQPSQRRGHPRLHPAPGRPGRRRRARGGAGGAGARQPGRGRGRRGDAAAPAPRLLRGVGRADDLGHRLGVRAGRHRRRRRCLPRVRGVVAGAGTDPGRSAGAGGARAGPHHRLVVRQEVPAGEGGGARRLAGRAGGARGRAARGQVGADPAAGTGGGAGRRERDRGAGPGWSRRRGGTGA